LLGQRGACSHATYLKLIKSTCRQHDNNLQGKQDGARISTSRRQNASGSCSDTARPCAGQSVIVRQSRQNQAKCL